MRAEEWDERYAERQQWSAEPERAGRRAAHRPAGGRRRRPRGGRGAARAVAGGARLAGHRRRLLRRRAGPGPRCSRAPTASRWVTADVTTWSATPASLDLVLVAYLHLPEAETRRCSRRAVAWLRPGRPAAGARARRREPDRRRRRPAGGGDPAQRRAAGAGRGAADVDRLEQVRRQTPAGTALDTLLWGRRTGPDGRVPAVACRHDGHGWCARGRGGRDAANAGGWSRCSSSSRWCWPRGRRSCRSC